MIEVQILDGNKRPLDAKVEVGDSRIVIHSRSGSIGKNERNPDYRAALEFILERLGNEGMFPTIYLDSMPVKDLPLASRLLLETENYDGTVAEQFNEIVRRSNADSRSKGAYRKLLLTTRRQPAYSIQPIIEGRILNFGLGQLPAAMLRKVQRPHIETAIEELSGDSPRWHSFANPREYWLIPEDGAAVPAKAAFGIALAEALRTYTHPYLFSSGPKNTAFRVMSDLGYDIEKRGPEGTAERYRATRKPPTSKQVDEALSGIPATEEERRWIEGNPKIATHLIKERNRNVSRKKKKQFIEENGRLWCERCDNDWIEQFGADMAEGCMEVHHRTPVSEMQPGHETTLDQLEILCANCHRVTHREMAREKSSR